MQRRRFLKSSLLGCLSMAGLPYLNQAAVGQTAKWEGKKMLILGDSITQAGDYINFLESTLLTANPTASTELINLGLASETISGLSEEAHPFPRPYLHDRLPSILSYTSPDIIFACYGINCGIYHPFDQNIFKEYQQGILRLMKAAEAQKAELILMTPPPHAAPVEDWKAARADADRKDYSYARPYLAYDDVMRRYADWLLSLNGNVPVVDLQTPMRRFQSLCYDQDYIHPNTYGHQLMTLTLLEALDWVGKKPLIALEANPSAQPDANSFGQPWIAPMPRLPYRLSAGVSEYDERVAGPKVKLALRHCPAGTYQLLDRHHLIGQYESDTLRRGIVVEEKSYTEVMHPLTPWQLSASLYDLLASRRKLYDYSLLQHIGHERPMHRKGLPIQLAEMKKRELQHQIVDMLDVSSWELHLVQVR